MSLLVTRRARSTLGLDPDRFGEAGRVEIASFASAYALADALLESRRTAEDAPAVGGEDLAALDLLEDLAEEAVAARLASDPDLAERLLERFADRLGTEKATERWERLADELGVEVDAAATPEPSTGDRRRACLQQLTAAVILRRHPLADRILGLMGFDESIDPEIADTLENLEEIVVPELVGRESGVLRRLAVLDERATESFEELLSTVAAGDRPGSAIDEQRIESVLGLLREAREPRLPPGHAPAPGIGLDAGPAAYSDDASWMPDLVLVAKNTLVWLEQLSRRHGRKIDRLDLIPDEDLERLAGRGFTGLWLIGLWERSAVSGTLKAAQGMGEATASAYAVRRYRIAEELGGEPALEELKRRAATHGLRLAADLVPNHTAIDSDWVIEHPQRFVWRGESPFPGYRFSGDDLSPDPRVELRVEDGYGDRTDAAVVFQRTDRQSGETRYLYHGNDGTSVPWNDTAQLDYTRADTRAAMIEEIVAVAKHFPILRFDAAMTLTRHHFHRLWFPASHAAGAIPSRAEHGLSEEAFAERMPQEFWREVVDRVAAEAPDTLLLAEAFWLMESYFVRRLGLHRVYNSAFMHMLRDGDTAGLRRLLQEALEIDPELLGRFANYLSTPDEETAIAQFGREARYFGACRVLVTLPGLPLFTHGQWDGLEERYGMEFRRPQRDEVPDEWVVDRHQREVAPLLERRRRFSGVETFRLLELADADGVPVDVVLAYANNTGADTVVVAFNNSDASVAGRLKPVAPFAGAGAGWDRAWPGLSDLGAEVLRDMTGERRVAITAEDHEAGAPRLELAPFECAVLAVP